jgi:hypothetical protein
VAPAAINEPRSTLAIIATGFDPVFSPSSVAQAPLINDRKAPHLEAAARPVRYTICDRSGNKQFAVQVRPFLPRPSEIPATPGDGCRQIDFVIGMTTRTVSICETSRKNRFYRDDPFHKGQSSRADMAGTTLWDFGP